MTDQDRISPEEIAALAKALFGPKWARPLADAVGVHLQTVYVWRREGVKADAFTSALARWIIRQEAALDLARRMVLDRR